MVVAGIFAQGGARAVLPGWNHASPECGIDSLAVGRATTIRRGAVALVATQLACSNAGVLQLDSGERGAGTGTGSAGSATEATSDTGTGPVGSGDETGTGGGGPTSECGEAPGMGTVHYVFPNGDDDAGDGSARAPWATIGYAVTQVADGALIEVAPGEYDGAIVLDGQFDEGIVVRAAMPYRAHLRHSGTVVTVATAKGITLEGFDITHDGASSEPFVVHIYDGIGPLGGDDFPTCITVRDNIIHDSYNDDLLRVSTATSAITVEGNMFYNQGAGSEQVDVNAASDVTIRGNVFFNDFEGSGRTNEQDTTSFVVVKDADGSADGIEGASGVTIDGNVFLSWQGTNATGYVLLAEDDTSFHEARDVLVQNNLMVMNGSDVMRAPFGSKSAADVVFRSNTVVGDAMASAFAFRLNVEGDSPPNEGIEFYNNVWSSPGAAMTDLTDTEVTSPLEDFVIDTNLYFNGGQAIPVDGTDVVNVDADLNAVLGDPQIAETAVNNPLWDAESNTFGGGAERISEVLAGLVARHGTPSEGGAGVGVALAAQLPEYDILGRVRAGTDLGALAAQ